MGDASEAVATGGAETAFVTRNFDDTSHNGFGFGDCEVVPRASDPTQRNAFRNANAGRSCYNCGQMGHMSRDCRAPSGQSAAARLAPSTHHQTPAPTQQRSAQACFKCNQAGHIARECPNVSTQQRPTGIVLSSKPGPSHYEPVEVPDDELWKMHITAGENFQSLLEQPPNNVQQSGFAVVEPIQRFSDAGFHEQLLENLHKANYELPTAVQRYSIPVIMGGQDLMACAQTGSGKTAAYLLPIVNDLLLNDLRGDVERDETAPVALIIAPTRELARQISEEARKFCYGTTITTMVLYGGTGVAFQTDQLRRQQTTVLVATVGRLNQFIHEGKISFKKVKYLVLDEADKMLESSSEQDIRAFIQHHTMPAKGKRKTVMVSATFTREVQQIANDFLNDCTFVTVGKLNMANHDINQKVIQVGRFDKEQLLLDLILAMYRNDAAQPQEREKVLVFVERKRTADYLAVALSSDRIRATSIHGDREQSQREEALRDFRSGRYPVLLATTVAARGLDIPKVDHVINFDLPQTIEEYVHRIGRTARLGNSGLSTSFFDVNSDNDRQLSAQLLEVLQEANQEVPEFLPTVAARYGQPSANAAVANRYTVKSNKEKDGFD